MINSKRNKKAKVIFIKNLDTLYERLNQTKHDPYDDFNSKVYGGLISLDMEKK